MHPFLLQEGVCELKMPDGTVIELPVLLDSNGAKFVDIRKLQPTTGICTFDPGFTSTAACSSSITYIDGNQGVLLYRG
jgi:citrate synthase